MGRLIDADAFRRYAHEQLEGNKTYTIDEILEMIDIQPTTYDVEKVVAELEEKRRNSWEDDSDYGTGKWSAFSKAISIVKAGKAVQHD